MSAQYGIWYLDGKPADLTRLDRVDSLIARYGPDGSNCYARGPMGMLYRAFNTTKEYRLERQPFVSSHGNVMMWDGRLDNRNELLRQLHGTFLPEPTDVAIAMAAYERWGTDCFRRLIGDWALSIWDDRDRVLLLAKDFVGPRHLHYSLTREHIEWCTVLDPLVLLAGHSLSLNEAFIAGYLGNLPPTHVTPYADIASVPASTFVRVAAGKASIQSCWQFDPGSQVRYSSDAEYEEHFRFVLRQSVRRRLRSDVPVLAELSGGIDSSSIVCMADAVIASGEAEAPRLDTISYYDDQEPNWDERPYFTKVEERRGRTGCHLDVGQQGSFAESMDSDHFCPLPGVSKGGLEFEKKRIACMEVAGNRVLLCGIGGDETLGGVPTPTPELSDLLVRGRFTWMARQLKNWSLAKKRPWIHLLFETVQDFLPPAISQVLKPKRVVPWLHARFAKTHRVARLSSALRTRILGPRPSFQSNMNTLAILRKQLALSIPSFAGAYDVAYPYLDRDLLAFVYSVPREQILRPGHRRSLMRRALSGLVPDEVLNRKRKAYVARRPLARIEREWPRLHSLTQGMVSCSLGFVDQQCFSEALLRAKHGQADNLVLLINTLKLELWLQDLSGRGLLEIPVSTQAIRSRYSLA